ncbi:MAG TPA: sugar phosphorylase [Deltaproteobacteria bacterium]|nr:sugar phosphorylase [Deltaproteobacteria bacterium]
MKEYSDYPRKRTFYAPDPDFSRPLYAMPPDIRARLGRRLSFLYGNDGARVYMPELERILKVHHAHKPSEMIEKEARYEPSERFSEQDLILITYGDIIKRDGKNTLATLHEFVNNFNKGSINTLHILPFFPYSSDRGFAVVDFRQVDPKLGNWDDIRRKKLRYDLMFDSVMNHVSSRSEMFREFIKGNPRYRDFFIAYDSPDALTPEQRRKIFRPRTSDILTPFVTLNGLKWVWTTFSEDQIDLNFRNPDVLLNVIEGILFYIRRGADILRLDAVTYLWAEPGTESVHLPQTHTIVKLVRDVVDAVASGVALVTETNVSHNENVSYFGNGFDEAHMVYNFALPPLVLHTFYRGDSRTLSTWAARLEPPSPVTTFFNILDTHDGIGLMGARGILTGTEIDGIIKEAQQRGAYISNKMAGDKTQEPYEINTTWWSAINGDGSGEDMDMQIIRYWASRSIALVLRGVPGVYLHGVLGSPNDHERVRVTGIKREVNRGIIDSEILEREFNDDVPRLSRILRCANRLHTARTRNRAFHPRGDQKILHISPFVFAVVRTSPEKNEHILALINVTAVDRPVEISGASVGLSCRRWLDILSGRRFKTDDATLKITLAAYEVVWLKPD